MNQVTDLKSHRPLDPGLASLRVDLAAAFRLAVEMDWHEAVGNHFSLAVSADGRQFLMNPRWVHFSLIRASDLLLLDSGDAQTMNRADAPDPSAWCIHGRIHAPCAARALRAARPSALCHGAGRAGRSDDQAHRPEHARVSSSAWRSTAISTASPTSARKASAWCACLATTDP